MDKKSVPALNLDPTKPPTGEAKAAPPAISRKGMWLAIRRSLSHHGKAMRLQKQSLDPPICFPQFGRQLTGSAFHPFRTIGVVSAFDPLRIFTQSGHWLRRFRHAGNAKLLRFGVSGCGSVFALNRIYFEPFPGLAQDCRPTPVAISIASSASKIDPVRTLFSGVDVRRSGEVAFDGQ